MSIKAQPGDLVLVTVYARVKEPFMGEGGYWITLPGVDLSILDLQVQQVIPMDILSEKAQILLRMFEAKKGGYWSTWSLTNVLQKQYAESLQRSFLNPTQPETEWDLAMEELIEADLIEEMPNLRCRYRLRYRLEKGVVQ